MQIPPPLRGEQARGGGGIHAFVRNFRSMGSGNGSSGMDGEDDGNDKGSHDDNDDNGSDEEGDNHNDDDISKECIVMIVIAVTTIETTVITARMKR